MPQISLGLVEVRSYVALIEAIDAMLKAANVKIIQYEKVGGGLVSVCISGDIGAVRVAIEAGQAVASRISEAKSALIANPNQELFPLLNANPSVSTL
ncbi:MAG: BMC domain-containing protein [Candidatus Tectomicrobia bacterium]|uniref:BMC domain-containing protein n=1 Tax=Tectimicrobiota bacterium TaxID=2528274 RepID=A0A933GKH7_UNCTE|nr:BMC domain-containing protein [Candidatus Tectomicrobia bacterium]